MARGIPDLCPCSESNHWRFYPPPKAIGTEPEYAPEVDALLRVNGKLIRFCGSLEKFLRLIEKEKRDANVHLRRSR